MGICIVHNGLSLSVTKSNIKEKNGSEVVNALAQFSIFNNVNKEYTGQVHGDEIYLWGLLHSLMRYQ